MLYLVNGVSESMKRDPFMTEINYPLSPEQFIGVILNGDYQDIIGHDNIARFVTELTGKKISKNRKGISLNYDDEVIVISFTGRLPERFKEDDIELKNRANFTYKRYVKQSVEDLLQSEERINEILNNKGE